MRLSYLPVYFRPLFPLISALFLCSLGHVNTARAAQEFSVAPEFVPPSPASDYVTEGLVGRDGRPLPSGAALPIGFCAEWNPEFAFNGHHCCARVRYTGRKRKKVNRCFNERRKASYCEEMTAEQRQYQDRISSGKDDALSLISSQLGYSGDQSYCTVNNGFLVKGRPIVPTAENRIQLRSPDRCTSFGTDRLVGMLEWTGRQVSKQYSASEYSGVHLVVGDISTPKGGCLPGRVSSGHASHTNGQDVDVSFLSVHPGRNSPVDFHKDFDAKANWWLVKQIFKNPFACVRVIFLDKTLIRKLAKAARTDPEWMEYGRFIRHIRGHKNHLHIRVGNAPGGPGCNADAHPELELDEDEGIGDEQGSPENPIDLMPNTAPEDAPTLIKAAR